MSLRLVYFGSGAFGLPTLRGLAAEHAVELVVSQPDRPAGRRRVPAATPIAAWARERGLEVTTPERADDPGLLERIDSIAPDALVVIAYGHKLGPALLADRFAINLHASLLPKYRGAAPINRAMIENEPETGVSVITLAQVMDGGLVLAARSTPIDPAETAGELHDRLADLGVEAVEAVLGALDRDGAAAVREQGTLQDPDRVTQAPKFTKAMGTVDFDQSADAVRARVHGLTPWPGCTIRLGDDRMLKLGRVEVVAGGDAVAGEPGVVQDDGTVACATGRVRLLEVQPPGKPMMSFDAYRNGHPVETGTRMGPR
ncbi:MAG: methionyl-tRNA formyltransferase [Planctomycetota bacterium]